MYFFCDGQIFPIETDTYSVKIYRKYYIIFFLTFQENYFVKTLQKQKDELEQKTHELAKIRNDREYLRRQNLVLQSAVDQAILQRDSLGSFWFHTLIVVASVFAAILVVLSTQYGYPPDNHNAGQVFMKDLEKLHMEVKKMMNEIRENSKLMEDIKKKLHNVLYLKGNKNDESAYETRTVAVDTETRDSADENQTGAVIPETNDSADEPATSAVDTETANSADEPAIWGK